MSLRDIEAATGVDRRLLSQARDVAAIPSDEFERIVEGDAPRDVLILARRRSRKTTDYTRRCPHCGCPLRMEDAR